MGEINGKWEPLSKDNKVFVTREHSFSTDTILLANFAEPKRKEICADFGTGSGVIPLIWEIKYHPKKIYAIEIQEQAVEQTKLSVKENNFEDNIEVIHADVRNIEDIITHQSCDLVSCNPPYKAQGTGLKNPDEQKRIARHEENLSAEELSESAAYALRFGGRLCVCQRPERLTDYMNILRENHLEPKRLRLVQQRVDSAPKLFLLEARKGGASGLVVEPALIIEDKNGYTEEMLEIYGEYRNGRD